MSIKILDCVPMMADVISGAVSEPRERRKHESPFQWLIKTPVMRRLEQKYPEFQKRLPTIKFRRDVNPPARTGLADFAHVFLITWEKPPNATTLLLCVNEDGTRCALADPMELLTEAWGALDRTGTGRPKKHNFTSEQERQAYYNANRAGRKKKI